MEKEKEKKYNRNRIRMWDMGYGPGGSIVLGG